MCSLIRQTWRPTCVQHGTRICVCVNVALPMANLPRDREPPPFVSRCQSMLPWQIGITLLTETSSLPIQINKDESRNSPINSNLIKHGLQCCTPGSPRSTAEREVPDIPVESTENARPIIMPYHQTNERCLSFLAERIGENHMMKSLLENPWTRLTRSNASFHAY